MKIIRTMDPQRNVGWLGGWGGGGGGGGAKTANSTVCGA